ncbi:MAG: cobalamin biosynthesis protein CbiG [Peptococcaceae bacterium]|nr:cobalamin biosynthesis protein CbiG [Peptococcaceae bacterium]
MKAGILSFTRNGSKLSLKLKNILQRQGYQVESYTLKEFITENNDWRSYEPDLKTVTGNLFEQCSLIVFVGASGIAVRSIAPFIRDKRTDPAVICLDDKGNFVIPLLSGHLGGANRIARAIAAEIAAQPVITTATDIRGLLAVDEWAAQNNLHICDILAAKKISALLLDGQYVGLHSDFEMIGEIPENVLPDESLEAGICISLNDTKKPFKTTLNLIPKVVYLGLGCKRNTSTEAIEELFLEILETNDISLKAVAGAATIDLKRNERGVLQFADKYSLPLTFFSGDELGRAEGNYSGSGFVKQVTGTDNVCERAAILLSNEGRLICRKTVKNGVTAALALNGWRVNFED